MLFFFHLILYSWVLTVSLCVVICAWLITFITVFIAWMYNLFTYFTDRRPCHCLLYKQCGSELPCLHLLVHMFGSFFQACILIGIVESWDIYGHFQLYSVMASYFIAVVLVFSYHWCVRVLGLHPWQYLALVEFLSFCHCSGKGYHLMVLFCICLTANKIKHLLICLLTIYAYFLVSSLICFKRYFI